MAVRRLNHAVLYVNGLAREVEFYTKTLGFEVRMEVPGRAAFLRSPARSTTTTLACSTSARATPTAARRSGCTTWRGRSARSRSSSRPGRSSSTPAPWSARATTACRSPCTPRTRAASSSRSCGVSRSTTGTPRWRGTAGTPSRWTGSARSPLGPAPADRLGRELPDLTMPRAGNAPAFQGRVGTRLSRQSSSISLVT